MRFCSDCGHPLSASHKGNCPAQKEAARKGVKLARPGIHRRVNALPPGAPVNVQSSPNRG
ncbi:MAG TPA: hypothetical protein VKY85_07710 [Candidatus Angelobacter sp.]|nr:hypothetical protein [Candidatus Angelobacter sp.]